MSNIPDDQKTAIGKVLHQLPYGILMVAMITQITDLILAHLNGYLISAMILEMLDLNPVNTTIGIGM